MSIFLAILALGLLIVVHEAGHYAVARLSKMRVERFSVGFGPALLRWRGKSNTQFQIAALPLGGFVQITGMNPHEEIDPHDPYVYPNRPTWQRFLTIFAGPATNYLAAIATIFFVFAVAGMNTGRGWVRVGSVIAGEPAAGKLQPGDRILAVNGTEVVISRDDPKSVGRFKELIQRSQGAPVTIRVLRDGKEREVVVTPELVTDAGTREYRVGIQMDIEGERAPVGIGTAAWESLRYPVDKSAEILVGLKKIVTREEKGEVLGPVGIADAIKQQIEFGWVRALEVLAMLSVYLGLFNLLPLPALDGGRLVFLGYELATRRRPNPRVEAAVHMIGFVALFLLMILVTFKDISRFFT